MLLGKVEALTGEGGATGTPRLRQRGGGAPEVGGVRLQGGSSATWLLISVVETYRLDMFRAPSANGRNLVAACPRLGSLPQGRCGRVCSESLLNQFGCAHCLWEMRFWS